MNFKFTLPNSTAGTAAATAAQPNREWIYLVRVGIVVVIALYLIWKLWFSWWMPSNEQPSTPETPATTQLASNVVPAGETSKAGLDAEMHYYTINDMLIVDKETFDVLLCTNGVSREGCTHTEINCANISDVDLWLRPEENLKRCIRNIAQGDNTRYNNPNQPPVCQAPERLHFSPSAMSYECK